MMRLASAILWASAGAACYLYLLNRLLIQLQAARHKSLLIRAGALLAVGSAGITGYWLSGPWWAVVPTAVLAAAMLGEARRIIVRRRRRGAPPVVEENAHIYLSRPRTTTDLAVRRYELPLAGWSGPRLRIAHLSDFHLNSHLPLSYYEDAMRRVGEAQPDLVFYTGDFVTYPQYVDLLPRVLTLASGRIGAFAVLGNHDYWANPRAVAEAVRASGVRLLRDEGIRVSVGDGHTLLIGGYEHPWSPAAALPPVPSDGEVALLLTHTPDNIFRLEGLGYSAVFAGHYHGGQICLPGVGPLVVPSNYGRLFDRGHFVSGKDTHLFITAGIGSAEPPLRLWCQPDLLLVDLMPDVSTTPPHPR